MKTHKLARYVFIAACIYDGLLGLAFLLVPRMVYDLFKVEYPNHMGYIQFPALLLIIFSIMFWDIAKDPEHNRNLIFYSILMKLAYASVVLAYWIGSYIPDMWKPFALADIVFAVLFYYVYKGATAIDLQKAV